LTSSRYCRARSDADPTRRHKLDQAEQRELLRLIRDLKDEVEVQRRKVRQPWRVQ